VEEILLWLFIWRVLNPLADYIQSLILSNPAILERSLTSQLIPSINISSIVSFILAILIVFGIFTAIENHKQSKKEATPKMGNITMPSSTQKRTTLFSKFFRRPPIEEEKRVAIWLAMIIGIIIGATMIAIAFSFLSTSTLLKTTFSFVVIYTMIGFGIFAIVFSTLFMVTELNAMREYRKKRNIDCYNVNFNTLSSFDNSFKSLKKATQPETRKIRLEDFENWLRVLCDLNWNNEVSIRITEVLNYVPNNLSGDSLVVHYVSWLKKIVNSYGKQTIPVVKEKFLTELETMYENPESIVNPRPIETNRDIIYLLIEFHEYDKEYLMRLVNDATNRWSDPRFQDMTSTIEEGFSGLSKRSSEEYRKFYDRLDEKMEVAEKNNDERAFIRLKTLLNFARGFLVSTHMYPVVEKQPIEISTFSEINNIISTLEMQNYRKIIYENADAIKEVKNISPELTETINYVATRHDRVAVILKDRPNDTKQMLKWIGKAPLLKTWKIIEPYVIYERQRRDDQDFVIYYEQLMNEYEKRGMNG